MVIGLSGHLHVSSVYLRLDSRQISAGICKFNSLWIWHFYQIFLLSW